MFNFENLMRPDCNSRQIFTMKLQKHKIINREKKTEIHDDHVKFVYFVLTSECRQSSLRSPFFLIKCACHTFENWFVNNTLLQ